MRTTGAPMFIDAILLPVSASNSAKALNHVRWHQIKRRNLIHERAQRISKGASRNQIREPITMEFDRNERERVESTDDVGTDGGGDNGLGGVKCGGVRLQGLEAAADMAEIEVLDGRPLHDFGLVRSNSGGRGVYGIF